MRFLFTCAFAFCVMSCITPQRRAYEILPRSPEYLLRAPDAHEIPLNDVLREFNGFVRGRQSIDLRSHMQVRVENAYYQKGFPRTGLNGYLGTEVARYEVSKHGLRLVSVVPMAERPETDRPVQELISSAELKFPYYRLYFEILFNRNTGEHGSVLIGANTLNELNLLADRLSDPQKLCSQSPGQCTIFPEACSVSVEMIVNVNGKPQFITWGSQLSSVVGHHPQSLAVQRLYRGRLMQVKLDLHDEIQLTLPLLPGDRITWQ